MNICYLLPIFALLLIPLSSDVLAESSSYVVKMPTGSASPDAPYYWQSEKDGSTTGIIEILVGDSVVWKNADTAVHTVTSGTSDEGPDDIFDSRMMSPGEGFPHEFSEPGNYPYYCLLHPWMIGEVIVTEGYSVIPGVGKDVGDGSIFFDVEYSFNRILSTATVDEDGKSITLDIVGVTKSDDNNLEIVLPPALVSGPFVVFVDDEIVEFEHTYDGDISILIIPSEANSETITIVGTTVVPEFGTVVMAVMIISISMIIIAHNRFKIQI